jgi:DNA-binding MarR family transcriptional regulator
VSEPQWLSAEEQQAWRAYLEATVLLFDALDRQLQRDAGMPHGYYEILVRLSESPERAMRMSELATRTRSSRSRLSHAVARLEERGWVERLDCPSDRRGQVAHLTDSGFDVLAAAAPGHVAEVRKYVVDRLSPDQISALEAIGSAIRAGLVPDDCETPPPDC